MDDEPSLEHLLDRMLAEISADSYIDVGTGDRHNAIRRTFTIRSSDEVYEVHLQRVR